MIYDVLISTFFLNPNRGAARNFVREGPVTDVVKFRTLAILHKIFLMSLVNFWSITTGYDVKYLLPVGIDKF